MYSKMALIAVVLISVIAAFIRLTNADSIEININKKLNNGQQLNTEDTTNVEIFYDCFREGLQIYKIGINRSPKFVDEDVKLYFANEQKNVLEVTATTKGCSGILYAIPHDSSPLTLGSDADCLTGESIQLKSGWFPQETNKVSASVKRDDEIYNYYGLKNFPISLPDTMVVDNFKNITCKAN